MDRQKRKVYMDLLRIVACFLVIFNHSPGYLAYQKSSSAAYAFYYMFFTMIARINVPIFFMLTGALLLPRDSTYQELFTKRIPRMLITLFVASFLYYIANNKNDLSSISIFDFLKKSSSMTLPVHTGICMHILVSCCHFALCSGSRKGLLLQISFL